MDLDARSDGSAGEANDWPAERRSLFGTHGRSTSRTCRGATLTGGTSSDTDTDDDEERKQRKETRLTLLAAQGRRGARRGLPIGRIRPALGGPMRLWVVRKRTGGGVFIGGEERGVVRHRSNSGTRDRDELGGMGKIGVRLAELG